MVNISDIFAVRSERLHELRTLVEGLEGARSVLGVAARFTLVVDTNIVLGDLLWLVVERSCPGAKTQLMEAVDAGTLEIHVPPRLLEEVEEKISRICVEKRYNEDHMRAEWLEYKKRLNVSRPDGQKVQVLKEGVDPDDADFIALAQTILAAGIFSKDKHIAMMGGNTISIDCIAHLRDYSRATAIELNIKINGIMLSYASMASAKLLFRGGKRLIERIGTAPGWVKCALLVGLVYIALNPGARDRIAGILKTVLSNIVDAAPSVLALLAETAELAASNQVEAQHHLERALVDLEKMGYQLYPQARG